MKKDLTSFIVLEKVFGNDCSIKKKNNLNFPYVFSNNFDIYDVSGSFNFIYIVPLSKELPIDILVSVYHKCVDSFNKMALLFLDSYLNKYQRQLKDYHISFVTGDGEHYLYNNDLSSHGYDFSNDGPLNSYTKTTQLVVNFYLNNEIKEYSTREIASHFDFTFTSVARANAFLYEINALTKRGIKNNAKYMIKSKADLLNKVKPYLINPIKRRAVVSVNENKLNKINGYLSGENALSKYTDLSADRNFKEIALDKSLYSAVTNKIYKNDNNQVLCYLEEFIYNPSYYSNDGTISVLDTYIIASKRYQNTDDPRIKSAIKALERRLVNNEK